MNRLDDLRKTKQAGIRLRKTAFWTALAGVLLTVILIVVGAVSGRIDKIAAYVLCSLIPGIAGLIASVALRSRAAKLLMQYEKDLGEMIDVPALFRFMGADVEYLFEGSLSQGDLVSLDLLQSDDRGIRITGTGLVRGQYGSTKFRSSEIGMTRQDGADDTTVTLYSGRITIADCARRFPGRLLLLREGKEKVSGLSNSSRVHFGLSTGLSKGIFGKQTVSVDPAWDSVWKTYTDDPEAAGEVLRKGAAFREALSCRDRINLVYYRGNRVVLGSRNLLAFDGETLEEAKAAAGESVRQFLFDIDAAGRLKDA